MPLRHDVVVIGLSPSQRTEIEWPLFARDEISTGGRLAKLFGWTRDEYHEKTFRVNAVTTRTTDSSPIVREGLRRISSLLFEVSKDQSDPPVIVGLGIRVCDAMLANLTSSQMQRAVLIPHPSGRNRMFNNLEVRNSTTTRLNAHLTGRERRAPVKSLVEELSLLHEQYPNSGIDKLWPSFRL